MVKTVQFTSEQDRLAKLEENKDLYWIGEKNIIDGDFLIFSDTLPQPPTEIRQITINETEWKTINEKQALMQKALDDLILGGVF